jgi:thymidine phosphorylase
MSARPHLLKLRRLGIDTYQEPVIYMRSDCDVCRAEGFEARSRIEVRLGRRAIIATLNVVSGDLLAIDEAGLSEHAWRMLAARPGDQVELSHPDPLDSLSALRAKVFGNRLDDEAIGAIVRDVAAGRYSDLHLAAFVTASAGGRLDIDETVALTRAMVDVGARLEWPDEIVADKHCVGGLPGNRTTLIVVPIVAACGVAIPKTSSRAITSPAGTADAMETLAPVDLGLAAIRRVVEREGGCIVWGAAAGLSPADDVLIRVERPLDFDSETQLVASVLSKKIAAGATHVVVDIPVGPTAKVRDHDAAAVLAAQLERVAARLGLTLRAFLSDGAAPVGRGIGPALEARDVLAVLHDDAAAPDDLRQRSLAIAADLLEFVGHVRRGEGMRCAAETLASGQARKKFEAICQAQGGLRVPPRAAYTHAVAASLAGRVGTIDNRRLARLAKLAGAPRDAAAGLDLHVRPGQPVARGEPLFTLHAESPGELDYALGYLAAHSDIVAVEEG